MAPRITLKTLAAELGVSHTTVSLALRDHPSISVERKAEIVALAGKLGYRPDPMLSALVAYRQTLRPHVFQGVLAWLTNYPTSAGWRIGQQVGYFEGAKKRANELGYELAEFWFREPDVSRRRLKQIIVSRNIQGVIVAAQPEPRTQMEFDWSGLAPVSLGYSLIEPKLHLVMNHQFRNMVMLVKRLIDLGYRRIGMAMPASRDERVEHNYLAGYLMGLYGVAGVESLPPHFPDRLDRDLFKDWYRAYKPEIIATEAGSAEVLEGWLGGLSSRAASHVPLALANIPYRSIHYTGIDEDAELVGRTAVDVVVGMIHRNEFGVPLNAKHILIQGTWRQARKVAQTGRSRKARRRESL